MDKLASIQSYLKGGNTMNIDANVVIQKLTHHISDLALQIAVLQAQVEMLQKQLEQQQQQSKDKQAQ